MKYILICALGGLLFVDLAVAQPADGDNPSAAVILREAYRSAVAAELEMADGRSAEALASYRDALRLYGQILANYPGWQADVVGYRIADCRNQIAAIQSGKGPALAGTAPLVATNAEARLTKLVDELRATLPTLSAAPAAGEPAGTRTDRELRRLREELDRALRENQALSRKLAKREGGPEKRDRSKAKGKDEQETAPRLVPSVIRIEARRLMANGDNEAAVALLKEAGGLLPEDRELTLLLGLACCHAEKYAEAAALLKQIIKGDPTNAAAYTALGTACMGLGELGAARVATEQALTLAPRSAEAHYNMAQMLLALEPPDLLAAEQHYKQAVALGSPPDADLEERLRLAIIQSRIHPKKR
jgi:tetratricopeptide (TPR) repeat protein